MVVIITIYRTLVFFRGGGDILNRIYTSGRRLVILMRIIENEIELKLKIAIIPARAPR